MERPRWRVVGLALRCTLAFAALPPLAAAELEPSGTEMWFAWPRTSDVTGSDPAYDLDSELLVLTTSAAPVPFLVEAPGLSVAGSAVAGAPGRVRIPRSLMMTTDGVVEARGIHLRAEACGPVAALFRVPGSSSSVGDDVMTLLPTTALGTTYFPDTYHGLAEFVVVATQDGTRVTYENPECPGVVDVVLNRGEAIQHLCDDVPASVLEKGLEGSRVVADKPVAVIAGSAASTVINYLIPSFPTPLNIFWCCADILFEQLRPVTDWERAVATVPFLNTGADPNAGDVLRITAACAGTEVVVDDGARVRTRTLGEGETWELAEGTPVPPSFRLEKLPLSIRATKPIQVMQYTIGWQVAGMGDPSQATVPGLLRPAGAHVFFTPEKSAGHANIVAPLAAAGLVALDGAAIPAGDWAPHPDGASAWTRVGPLLPGEHVVTSPGVPVSVLAFGYTLDDTGAIVAGAHSHPAPSFGPDDDFPSLVQPEDPCAVSCPGACVTLDAGPGYGSYAWSTGESERTIVACPDVTTTYEVRVTDLDLCPGLGVVEVPVLGAPRPDIAGGLVACDGGCVDLSVAPGFATVAWSTGDVGDTARACPAGPATNVSVVVTNADGCEGRDEVTVLLLRPPDLGAAAVADVSPCDAGLLVSWDAATWNNAPADGTYRIHRSEGDCADALAAPPLVTDLRATSWLDATSVPGVTYTYLVVAEDVASSAACVLTAEACVTGAVDVLDEAPPSPGEGATLRGEGHSGPNPRFRWDGAPALDAGESEHFHLHRSASVLGPFERITPEGFMGRSFVDPRGADARVLFYDLRVADRCENATLDPFPPSRCLGPPCAVPVLARGHAFSWDTCGTACAPGTADHGCGPAGTDGAERAHVLETTADGPLRILLDAEVPSLDLFLHEEASGACVAWGDGAIALPVLPAGRYLVVVDGPAGSVGSYAVTWAAR